MRNRIKKCCLNCAFCCRENVFGVYPLSKEERQGDFSFLCGIGGMPNQTLKCIYDECFDHSVTEQPTQQNLLKISVCAKKNFCNYLKLRNRSLVSLKKEKDERISRRTLYWTMAAVFFASISCIMPYVNSVIPNFNNTSLNTKSVIERSSVKIIPKNIKSIENS